jgi:hypothetical protein
MTLLDFRTELKSRGFDGFADVDLNVLINRGYFYVARKVPAYWDMADFTGATPSDGKLAVQDTGSLAGFKSVEAVYWRSGTTYIRLEPVPEQDFRDSWLVDYQAGVKGNPQVYYIDGNTLWVLPKMTAVGSSTIELRYNKRPQAMTADTNVPITPIDMDEVILTASLVRCHKRANESSLAMVAQQELDEFLNDALDLESTRMQDQQERVSPDDQWA